MINIYTLTKEDTELFAKLIPEDYAALTGRAGYFTIGAVDDEAGPAGVLQFFVGMARFPGLSADHTGKILWVAVDEAYEAEEMVRLLLDEMMRVLEEGGIRLCEADIPVNDSVFSFGRELQDYGFSLSGETFIRYQTTLGEVLQNPRLNLAPPPIIHGIRDLSLREYRRLLGDMASHSLYEKMLLNMEQDYDFWDDTLSCYYTDRKGSGLFLVRRHPSGTIEPQFIGAIKGKKPTDGVYGLILFGARAAKKQGLLENKLLFSCFRSNLQQMVRKLLPDLEPVEMLHAVLEQE